MVAASGRDLQMRELMDTMKELKLTIEVLRKELTTKDKLIENLQEQIAYLQKKLSALPARSVLSLSRVNSACLTRLRLKPPRTNPNWTQRKKLLPLQNPVNQRP